MSEHPKTRGLRLTRELVAERKPSYVLVVPYSRQCSCCPRMSTHKATWAHSATWLTHSYLCSVHVGELKQEAGES